MATLPVKWYDHRFHGLPILNGTPGSFTNLLDAVLVNGFGDTKVVSINVLNKKASIVLRDSDKFFKKAVVLLKGFTNQSLNGEYRVEESDNGKIIINLDLPDGQVEDNNVNIVVKYAPLGWFKPFSGVSRAIYKPSAIDALKWMFYVDDTAAQWAEVRINEGATSLDNQISGSPYNSTLRWGKSNTANTTSRPWYLIGDPYCFYWRTSSLYWTTDFTDYPNHGCVMFVGEGVRLTNKSDQFSVYLSGQYNKKILYTETGDLFSNSSNTIYTLRTATGAKLETKPYTVFRGSTSGQWSNFSSDVFYTDDCIVQLFVDNYLVGNDRRVTKLPGLITCNSFRYYNNFDFFVEPKDNNLNKDLIFARSSNSAHSSSDPARGYFFDITGPWR